MGQRSSAQDLIRQYRVPISDQAPSSHRAGQWISVLLAHTFKAIFAD